MLQHAHNISIDDLASQQKVDLHNGLTEAEAKNRLLKFGENSLKRTNPKSIYVIFIEQFLDPVIYVLLVAMILAFIFGEFIEGAAVLVVILITAVIGFFMEWRALRSVESLQKLVPKKAVAFRDGSIKNILASKLVPGDIIIVNAGMVVPADSRLIKSESLAVKEAVLTGESNQVEKHTDIVPLESPIAEHYNMLYKGTIVSRGKARALVTGTGDHTVIGQISNLTQEAEKTRTPLEKRLRSLSKWLIWLTIILALFIAVSGYFQGKDLMLMIETGIALAVAAIPEGLPIVATIALARGMVKLSKQQVIIKKLEAVQTLGETGIICTDKTGTLTENKMAVHTLVFEDESLQVGKRSDDKVLDPENNEVLSKLALVSVLCNNHDVNNNIGGSDAIEIALVNFFENTGFDIMDLRESFHRIDEIPFDAEKKLMASVHHMNGGSFIGVKGALESIIECCDKVLTNKGVIALEDLQKWEQRNDEVASEGMRVLAFAFKQIEGEITKKDYLKNLTFIGLIGFLDPPRQDIQQAMQTYRKAGIKVVMVTGDHPDTAKKIAEDVGLLDSLDKQHTVIKGGELTDLSKLTGIEKERILNARVFARMAPKQKLDLIDFYQQNNAIVGMLGDGVNDAPALKKANIGIAMGIRGTEAAKEVADVILLDDKFTSTELAIRQGRTIFANIRQFVVYLLSCNLAEIISVGIASISNLPLPLLPLQILFLNLVTDVFPALALGFGKGDSNVMLEKPRDPKEPILKPLHWKLTLFYGATITASVIGITVFATLKLNLEPHIVNNMAFYTLILAQLLNVFNLPNSSFFKNEVTRNVWIWVALAVSTLMVVLANFIQVVSEVLSLVPLTLEQFSYIGLFAILSVLLTQLVKRLFMPSMR